MFYCTVHKFHLKVSLQFLFMYYFKDVSFTQSWTDDARILTYIIVIIIIQIMGIKTYLLRIVKRLLGYIAYYPWIE